MFFFTLHIGTHSLFISNDINNNFFKLLLKPIIKTKGVLHVTDPFIAIDAYVCVFTLKLDNLTKQIKTANL